MESRHACILPKLRPAGRVEGLIRPAGRVEGLYFWVARVVLRPGGIKGNLLAATDSIRDVFQGVDWIDDWK